MKKQFYKFAAICSIAAIVTSGLSVPGTKAKTAPRISLNYTKKTLQKGKKVVLTVKKATKTVKWSVLSGKTKITLKKKGKTSAVVTAKKAGTATVQAKVGSKKLTCKITVKAASQASSAPTPTPAPAVSEKLPSETTNHYYDSTKKYAKYAISAKEAGNNNTLLTNAYACDPFAMEYNGRVYIYMTNDSQQYAATDLNGANGYGYIQSVHIISSDDMVNWTDHGIYQIAGANGVCKWANCCWAPSAVHKTVNGQEKFYMFFTNGGWQLGVVEADTPYGPWKDVKGSALITSGQDTTSSGLDPAAFIDDDGTAWLTYGSGNQKTENGKVKDGARLRKLNDDMISFAGDEIVLDAPYMNEDSSLNKIGDTYYYSYCGDWTSGDDHQMCSILYMTSKNIEGPYTYQGDVLPNCGSVFKSRSGDEAWGNNHHSILEFKGKQYMFYHTMVLQDQLYCKNTSCSKLDAEYLGYRSTAINELKVNKDGSLGIVQQDLKGVSQIKNFDPYQETSGTVYSNCAGMEAIHMNYDKVLKTDTERCNIYRNSGLFTELTYKKTDSNMPDYLFASVLNPNTGKTTKKEIYYGYLRTADGARMEAVANPSRYQYSWSSLKGVDFGKSAPKKITVSLTFDKNTSSKTKFRVTADSTSKTVLAEDTITAGKDGKATVTLPVKAITGVHDIYFEFGGAVYSFDNWKFEK